MDKSIATNLIAAIIMVLGFFSPVFHDQLFSIGIFALSGAVTNWLAVYMLFERVPFLYGSGVIPSRFEEFRLAIKSLVMEQFFNQQNVERFINQEESSLLSWFKPHALIDAINYDILFQRLVETIMTSSFGTMLNMFGGASALEKLREPFIIKMKSALVEIVEKPSFSESLAKSIDSKKIAQDFLNNIEALVDKRLRELTPELVKQIIQDMIKKHLGWLVVWGGVLGGVIGLAASFVK